MIRGIVRCDNNRAIFVSRNCDLFENFVRIKRSFSRVVHDFTKEIPLKSHSGVRDIIVFRFDLIAVVGRTARTVCAYSFSVEYPEIKYQLLLYHYCTVRSVWCSAILILANLPDNCTVCADPWPKRTALENIKITCRTNSSIKYTFLILYFQKTNNVHVMFVLLIKKNVIILIKIFITTY